MNTFPKALIQLCLAGVVLLMAKTGRSQEVIPDLGSLGVDAAREYLENRTVERAARTEDSRALTASALRSGNLELIKLVVRYQDLLQNIWEEFEMLPDSSVKGRIFQMLLRIDSDALWPWEDGLLTKRRPTFFRDENAPPPAYAGYIIRHLPTRPFSWDMVTTLEARQQLAGELEAAMHRDDAISPPPTIIPSSQTNLPPHGQVEDVTRPHPLTERISEHPITPTQWMLWTLAVLAGIGAVTFLIKRRTEG